MGRYDGEEYVYPQACRSGLHNFAINGSCHVCGRSREGLIAEAKRVLELAERGELGCTHRCGAAPNRMCRNCGVYLGAQEVRQS